MPILLLFLPFPLAHFSSILGVLALDAVLLVKLAFQLLYPPYLPKPTGGHWNVNLPGDRAPLTPLLCNVQIVSGGRYAQIAVGGVVIGMRVRFPLGSVPVDAWFRPV